MDFQILIKSIPWGAFVFIQLSPICKSHLIAIVLACNIIVIKEFLIEVNPFVVTGLTLLLVSRPNSLDSKYNSIVITFALSCLILFLEPAFGPVLILNHLLPKNKNTEIKRSFDRVFITAILLFLSLASTFYLHKEAFYSSSFSPSLGVSWMLYSHVFERYLVLYQTIMLIAPYLVILPLSLSKTPVTVKIAISWFFCIYMLPKTTLAHVWALYYLEFLAYKEIMTLGAKTQQVIWTLLPIITTIVSISSYIFYERQLWLWQHSHLVSMGYLLMQILLFWGAHVVYLSEALTILDPSKKEKVKTRLGKRIKEYLLKKVKEM